jgi:hypothetical protein
VPGKCRRHGARCNTRASSTPGPGFDGCTRRSSESAPGVLWRCAESCVCRSHTRPGRADGGTCLHRLHRLPSPPHGGGPLPSLSLATTIAEKSTTHTDPRSSFAPKAAHPPPSATTASPSAASDKCPESCLVLIADCPRVRCARPGLASQWAANVDASSAVCRLKHRTLANLAIWGCWPLPASAQSPVPW